MQGKLTLAFLLLAAYAEGFAPQTPARQSSVDRAATADMPVPYFIDLAESQAVRSQAPAASSHKDGVFSPLVYWAKDVLGDQQLNKVRGEAISLHSSVIKNFVATSDSKFGNSVLKFLFKVADKNGNGKIEQEELEQALQKLGFQWLQKKQMQGIFARAGGKDKGYLTLEEWMAEAPKTLKTNLVKLAKTNGGNLGFLV